MAKIFKALSNDQRLKLFIMIYEWQGLKEYTDEEYSCCTGMEKTFTKACNELDLCRATISHHFKELQNAGLISCTRNGQSFNCKIVKETVDSIREFLK